MALDVGTRALKTSARQHHAASDSLGPTPTSALLLFYAVECGLKEALMIRQALSDTSELPEELRSHDLRRLVKELRLPPAVQLDEGYRLERHGSPTRIVARDLHQAWRYGRVIIPDDQTIALNGLQALFSWYATEKGW